MIASTELFFSEELSVQKVTGGIIEFVLSVGRPSCPSVSQSVNHCIHPSIHSSHTSVRPCSSVCFLVIHHSIHSYERSPVRPCPCLFTTCLSVRLSVCLSVCPSVVELSVSKVVLGNGLFVCLVRPSVRASVRPSVHPHLP